MNIRTFFLIQFPSSLLGIWRTKLGWGIKCSNDMKNVDFSLLCQWKSTFTQGFCAKFIRCRIESESEQMSRWLKVCQSRNFLCLSIFILTIVLVIPIRGIDHAIDDAYKKLINFLFIFSGKLSPTQMDDFLGGGQSLWVTQRPFMFFLGHDLTGY